MVDVRRRLTWKFGGEWFVVTNDGRNKRMRWWDPRHFWRACDRVFVGRDNGRNHW